ncbi:MAG: autotransporter-associated beta strand repeat-containing protein, partial [Opitutaceae bacterium]|nr:autotransporter-associated beta strand repeat-containing protein [Opitutaceae bacterium]
MPGRSNDVIFDNTYTSLPATIQLRGNRSILNLTFDTDDDLALINGNGSRTLDLYGSSITQTAASDGNHSLDFTTLRLRTNTTFDTSGSTGLTVSSAITESGGARTLTKTGSGNLIFTGSNTYSGLTTISDGTLVAAHANALGSTAAGTTIGTGGILGLSGSITLANEAIANSGLIENLSGSNAYGGVASGTGNLLVSGGTLTLSGSNTYTGTTTVNGSGTLALGADNALSDATAVTVNSG